MPTRRGHARIDESRQELDQLADEISAWSSRRRERDSNRQYGSQLTALEQVTTVAIKGIREQLDDLDAGLSTGEVYEICRSNDRRALFVHRFWGYFREKWDQRDDSRFDALLQAADEVVWSCYVTPFRTAGVERGPAPLAYVQPEYSPHAVVRSRPPQELRTIDDLLELALSELPVPVIAIPPVCVRRPWWLVLLAHEIGHHVEFDLNDGLPRSLKQVIDGVASDEGLEADPWLTWSHELFADAYGAFQMGGAHLWALGELERGPDAAMLDPKPAYPPPLLRHAFIAELLRGAGLPLSEALPTRLTDPREALARLLPDGAGKALQCLMRALTPLARAFVGRPLQGRATLPELCGWDGSALSANGDVGWWRGELTGIREPVPEQAADVPRLLTAASVGAAAEILDDEDPERRDERIASLRDRLLIVLPQCREPGTRAAPGELDTRAGTLADLVGENILRLRIDEVPAA